MKSSFEIAGRRVGKGEPCYVIAEAGVNHNCDLALGKRLVETAKSAGADAIKFQSYTASKIATRKAPRYWFEADDPKGSQWDTFDRLDKLSDADFKALLAHAKRAAPERGRAPSPDERVTRRRRHRAEDHAAVLEQVHRAAVLQAQLRERVWSAFHGHAALAEVLRRVREEVDELLVVVGRGEPQVQRAGREPLVRADL